MRGSSAKSYFERQRRAEFANSRYSAASMVAVDVARPGRLMYRRLAGRNWLACRQRISMACGVGGKAEAFS
jgi:hypothetical protein